MYLHQRRGRHEISQGSLLHSLLDGTKRVDVVGDGQFAGRCGTSHSIRMLVIGHSIQTLGRRAAGVVAQDASGSHRWFCLVGRALMRGNCWANCESLPPS